MQNNDLITGKDGQTRCAWCGSDPLYIDYHDNEWGRPVYDDVRLFEKLCLEGFQSGLSWITILKKRENFRRAFDDFNFEKVATYTEKNVQRLLQNEGIIRHRGKIEATINNAQITLNIIEKERSFSDYLWQFQPKSPPIHKTKDTVPDQTPESQALAKALKQYGWKFIGPTTVYAFMQAMGMVNDHLEGCDFNQN